MNPRERLLGVGRWYISRGEPIPLTILSEADKYGLDLTEFDQPKPVAAEGETHVFNSEEDLHDGPDHSGLRLPDEA